MSLSPEPTPRGVSKAALLAYAVAAAVVALDQASKFWIVHVYRLPEGVSVPILPVFSLTGVMNRGVSYGFLQGGGAVGRWGLVAFRLVVAAAIAVWGRRIGRVVPALALGLIMGGAIGNAIDGVLTGRVIDFLDFSGLHFPWVFNVADSGITVGAVLLILDGLWGPRRDEGGRPLHPASQGPPPPRSAGEEK